MAQATITNFGIQSGTDRTVYATWTWSKKNTENYKVAWDYYTDGVWFVGSHTTTEYKESMYEFPENAQFVRFRVVPQSKTRKVNGKETKYWTASWTSYKTYIAYALPPTKPGTPNVEVEDYRLTATLENLDVNATFIQFKVVENDSKVYKISDTTIREATNSARYACIITPGNTYKVACRACKDTLYSEWSDYSEEVSSVPRAPATITTCRANSDKSIYLEWDEVPSAETYDIEYTTKREYFDGSDATTEVNGIETTHYELTGLTAGELYFFRVRAVNENGESGWSGIKSSTLGKEPAAPTTWSSTTTAITGEPLNLYWVHNSSDGSSQTYGELELIIDGVKETHTIKNSEDEDEKDKTSVYPVDTSKFKEGSKIEWRVRTAGVTKVYGEWSIQRVVDIYSPPTLAVEVTDAEGSTLDTITSLPFYISALAGPKTQAPIGYHLTIVTHESYETIDDIGNTKLISKGDEVYSKYFDISSALLVEFSADNIDLENNVRYTVRCVVTMNSGLNAEGTTQFGVSWTEAEYEPDAEIGIDRESLTASIRPYCEDEEGNLVPDLYLSVYRREFDGTFTQIIKNVDNSDSLFVTDPHPALDYARYRIVATSKTTGAVSYYDVPGYPVEEPAVIIQWAEEWSTFDTTNEDEMADPAWDGSMLRLPYNIDVSNNHSSDVSMVEYIGRKRPVTYYGTQLGETATWNVAVPKEDVDTLYALRRLAIWMGDVYVREPSGSGYWANISVSFSQKHTEVTMPVTLNITRVEGGM